MPTPLIIPAWRGINRAEYPAISAVWSAQYPGINLADRSDVAAAGTVVDGLGSVGKCYVVSSGGSDFRSLGDPDSGFLDATECTIAIYRQCRDTTGRNAAHFGYFDGSGRVLAHAPLNDGNIYFDYGSDPAGRVSGAYTKDTAPETLVFVASGNSSIGRQIWRRGILIHSNTNTASRPATGETSFGINTAISVGSPYAEDNVDLALMVVAKRAWTPGQIRRFCADPGSVLAPAPRRVYFAVGGGGGNVTRALTGVAATGAVGNLGPQIAYALTGVAATAAVGSLGSALAYGLTGVVGTGAVGSLVPNIDYGLTGVQATGQVGNLGSGSDVTIALTGVQATGAVGNLGPAIDYALTGVQGTGAVGSLGASPSYALTGVQASGAVGSFGPEVSYGLTGVQATGQVGDLARSGDVTIALTGVQATGQVGNLGVQTDGSGTEPFPGPYGSGGGGERTDSRSGTRKPTKPRNIALEQEEALREAVLIAEADEEEDIAMIVAILAATGVL